MNELTLDGKTYVSSKRAAEITGYAKDYIGQLCREGRVEARLVGRNWYILESSIREHRFGEEKKPKDEEKAERSFASSAWDAPRYASEAPPTMPSLSVRMSVNAFEAKKMAPGEENNPERSPILKDMQSAWQEWFSSKQDVAPQQVVEEREEITEEIAIEASDESFAIPLQSLEDPEEVEIRPVAAYEPEAVLDLSHREVGETETEETYEEKSVTVTRPPGRSRGPRGISSLLIQSLLIAIMVIAIAITVVGTGYAGKLGVSSISRLSEIRYITGESTYIRK